MKLSVLKNHSVGELRGERGTSVVLEPHPKGICSEGPNLGGGLGDHKPPRTAAAQFASPAVFLPVPACSQSFSHRPAGQRAHGVLQGQLVGKKVCSDETCDPQATSA